MNDKAARLKKANNLILTIANCGRKFFQHNERISRFELDARGRIWFIDAYRESRIYTHYTHGRWQGFSEGGTLRDLVIALRKYIASGTQLNPSYLGPYPEWYSNGDPWGYGEDMPKISQAAVDLQIILPTPIRTLKSFLDEK